MNNAVVLLRDRSFYGANIANIPVIYLVKKHLLADNITLFSDINLEGFYQQLPWVGRHYSSRSFLSILEKVDRGSSLLYSMRPSMDSAPFLGVLKGVKVSLGFSLRSNLLNRLYDYHLPYTENEYRGLTNLQPLIRYYGLKASPLFYMREAFLALARIADSVTHNRICIMPGAGAGEHKKWGIHNYWKLVRQLHRHDPNLQFDFVLGPDEAYERAFLQQQDNKIKIAIHDSLRLEQLVSLVDQSLLTVANDCGPSHVCQGLVKPFVGLYPGPNPEWFLKHETSCSLAPANNDLKSLDPQVVFEAVLDLFNKLPLATPSYLKDSN